MSCLLVEKADGALQDVPDPATGLTPRQKRYVTESWAIVKKDLRTHGRGVLLAISITYDPYYLVIHGSLLIQEFETSDSFLLDSWLAENSFTLPTTNTFMIYKPLIELKIVLPENKFFIANPMYIKNFRAFQNMQLSELPENKKFHAHANAVIYALSSIVDNLDETEVLVEMLRKLGQNHGQRNIEKVQFNRLRFALMEYLKENLGQEIMTTEAEEAWNEVLDVAFSIIFEGVELGMKNAIY